MYGGERMDGGGWGGGGGLREGRQDRQTEREREEGKVKGGVCLVISSRSLPSAAVVRWLAGRPEGPMACAGPPTQRRSGPGCHLGCSGRSS